MPSPPLPSGKPTDAPTGGAVALTGASSQIGHFLMRRLAAAGIPGLALVHRTVPDAAPDGVDIVRAETEGFALAPDRRPVSGFISCAPIFTAAAWTAALAPAGLHRAIAFSSSSVDYKIHSRAASERAAATATLAGEETFRTTCESLGVAWTILRPTMIYGCGMDRNMTRLAGFIRRWRFMPLPTGATGLRQPVHADDLAASALAGLGRPDAGGRTISLGGGERLPYRAMVRRLFEALGMPPVLVPVPGAITVLRSIAPVGSRLAILPEILERMRLDLVVDNGPAARLLGHEPGPFDVAADMLRPPPGAAGS